PGVGGYREGVERRPPGRLEHRCVPCGRCFVPVQVRARLGTRVRRLSLHQGRVLSHREAMARLRVLETTARVKPAACSTSRRADTKAGRATVLRPPDRDRGLLSVARLLTSGDPEQAEVTAPAQR